jgi:glycerol-3-phosphate O-acyltransferase
MLKTILDWIYELQAREKFTETLYNSVVDQYNVLKSAIFRDRGAVSLNPAISLSQPWRW